MMEQTKTTKISDKALQECKDVQKQLAADMADDNDWGIAAPMPSGTSGSSGLSSFPPSAKSKATKANVKAKAAPKKKVSPVDS